MSRPLFVGSYLQVTWWALGQWKGRKNASNDNQAYLLRSEITKSHLNNHICQYCGMRTSTVTSSLYYVLISPFIIWRCLTGTGKYQIHELKLAEIDIDSGLEFTI